MLCSILVATEKFIVEVDKGTYLDTSDGSFDGSNDGSPEGAFLVDSIVSYYGIKLGSSDGNIDGTE